MTRIALSAVWSSSEGGEASRLRLLNPLQVGFLTLAKTVSRIVCRALSGRGTVLTRSLGFLVARRSRPQQELRCRKPGRPMNTAVILLVTWFVSGQPPSSYQAAFDSMTACEAAREQILAQNQALKTQEDQRNASMDAWIRVHGGLYVPGEAPYASAVCVAKADAPPIR